MSGTMNGHAANGWTNTMFRTFQHSDPMIGGVCARLADRAGLPVVLLRVAAVILLLAHGMLVMVLYLCAAAWLRGGRRSYQPPARDRSGLADRFTRLERRLATMEGAALDQEMGLRRAFRDLER